MDIVYDRIANRGLVSARNRAMSLALSLHPEFLAIIDDDEVPRCSVPAFDGTILTIESKEALWARFYRAVPDALRTLINFWQSAILE